MPILNYTTSIAAIKTIGEIQAILVTKGVRTISVDYAPNGEPVALIFIVEINEQRVPFRLPSNWRGVLMAMRKDKKVPARLTNEDQAKRVAWRIVKDWVEAQMAFIEAGLAEIGEVFMPYAVVASTNQTLFEYLKSNPKLLTQPDESRLLGDGKSNVIEGDFTAVNE